MIAAALQAAMPTVTWKEAMSFRNREKFRELPQGQLGGKICAPQLGANNMFAPSCEETLAESLRTPASLQPMSK